MLSLAALHAERSSALIFLVSSSTESIRYYAKRYSGWQYWVQHCSRVYSNGFSFWWASPLHPPKSILGIPFQKKCFKVFLSQRRGSRCSLFLLISCSFHPHTETLFPLCSRLCPSLPLLCCRPSEILQCRKATSMMQTFHSLLVEWFNKFTLDGTSVLLLFFFNPSLLGNVHVW